MPRPQDELTAKLNTLPSVDGGAKLMSLGGRPFLVDWANPDKHGAGPVNVDRRLVLQMPLLLSDPLQCDGAALLNAAAAGEIQGVRLEKAYIFASEEATQIKLYVIAAEGAVAPYQKVKSFLKKGQVEIGPDWLTRAESSQLSISLPRSHGVVRYCHLTLETGRGFDTPIRWEHVSAILGAEYHVLPREAPEAVGVSQWDVATNLYRRIHPSLIDADWRLVHDDHSAGDWAKSSWEAGSIAIPHPIR